MICVVSFDWIGFTRIAALGCDLTLSVLFVMFCVLLCFCCALDNNKWCELGYFGSILYQSCVMNVLHVLFVLFVCVCVCVCVRVFAVCCVFVVI